MFLPSACPESSQSTGRVRAFRLALFAGATALLMSGVTSGTSRATTFTVCPSGCDFSTIQAALNSGSTTGNHILVSAGTYRYTSEITIADKDGTAGSPTVLQADGQVIIDCADPFGDSTWTQHTGNVYRAARLASLMTLPTSVSQSVACWVHVDDVRYSFVNDTTYTSLAEGEWAYDTSAGLVYVRLFGGGSPSGRQIFIGDDRRIRGFRVRRSHYFVIDGFTIKRATGAGILIEGDTTTGVPKDRIVAVNNCNISHCWRQGMQLSRTASAAITNNTTHSNGDHGIQVIFSDSAQITGNTSYLNDHPLEPRGGKNGIRVGNGVDSTRVSDVNVDYNVVYQNEDTGIEILGARRVVVRRNLIYKNRDHGVDNNITSRTAFINNVIYANDHDGISVENTSRGVWVLNNILVHNARTVSTLEDTTKDIAEMTLLDTTALVSNHNVIKPLMPGDIPSQGDAVDRHVVNLSDGGSAYFNTFRGWQLATGHDAVSDSTMPVFTDTTNAVFTLGSGTTFAVDAAKTDITGWRSPMWLSADPTGAAPHNANETDIGVGSPAYGDIGVFEYDPVPGTPTIVVAGGRWDFVVMWDELGDDDNLVTAGTHEVFINGAGLGAVAASAPGTPICFDIDSWSDCTAAEIKVKITEADNGKTVWSNTVNASTDCAGNQAYMCDEGGMVASGDEESSTFALEDGRVGAVVDYPLSLSVLGTNPTRSLTGIVYGIPKAMAGSPYELSMFDVSGRRVWTSGSGVAKAGRVVQQLGQEPGRAAALNAGVYFIRLRVADKVLTRTVMLVP